MTSCPGSTDYRMANRRGVVHAARSVRPHLDAIDPAAVGSYAADLWLDRAGPLASSKARAVIGEHVASLARYAQTGAGGADEALEELSAVVVWLFARWIDEAPDPMTVLLDAPDGADEDRMALAVVLLAARGRIRLAREDRITGPELTALTGLDQSSVARLARQGKIERAGEVSSKQHPPPITGQSARELLREHGVRGV